MRTILRSSILATILLAIAFPAAADDGPTLYRQLCASCHDTGAARAPTRDVLQAMTPERVLTALESGAMLSMASGRTGVERMQVGVQLVCVAGRVLRRSKNGDDVARRIGARQAARLRERVVAPADGIASLADAATVSLA